MDKYIINSKIGDGSFGSVVKATNRNTGRIVAIKKMKQKFYNWEECVNLPEVKVQVRGNRHPNVVEMIEVIREGNELFFVFECLDGDLLGVIQDAKAKLRGADPFTTPAMPYPTVKSYARQMLQALAFVHKRGYFHRDVKPENYLIKRDPAGEDVVKLGDFGLVKLIRDKPPFTDYVSTRWYRGPELLMQTTYGPAIDIWAIGCILAEIIALKPLFPGSNEADQMLKIMNIMGSPTEETWPGCTRAAKRIRYKIPAIRGCGLASVLPRHIPAQALDLISQMLDYDVKKRPTAEQCLQHPFFSVGIDEDNGMTTGASAQLAAASERMRQYKHQTSPHSAPGALTGPDAGTSAANSKSKAAQNDRPPTLPSDAVRNYYARKEKDGVKESGAPLSSRVAFGAGDATEAVPAKPSYDAHQSRTPTEAPPASLVTSIGKDLPPAPVRSPSPGQAVPQVTPKALHLKNARRANALKNLNAIKGANRSDTGSEASPDSGTKATYATGGPKGGAQLLDKARKASDPEQDKKRGSGDASASPLGAPSKPGKPLMFHSLDPSMVDDIITSITENTIDTSGPSTRSKAKPTEPPGRMLLKNSRNNANAGLLGRRKFNNALSPKNGGPQLPYGNPRSINTRPSIDVLDDLLHPNGGGSSSGVTSGGGGAPVSTPSVQALLAKYRR